MGTNNDWVLPWDVTGNHTTYEEKRVGWERVLSRKPSLPEDKEMMDEFRYYLLFIICNGNGPFQGLAWEELKDFGTKEEFSLVACKTYPEKYRNLARDLNDL